MKKLFKVLGCLVLCLIFGGCFNKMYTRTATNEITCKNCTQVTNVVSLLDNVEKTMNNVSGISFEYVLTNTKKTFTFNADMITNGKRVNWDFKGSVKYDDISLDMYLKDKKLYVVYPHNGANIVMKDSMENFVIEAKESLELLNATYDKENFEEFMLGDKLSGLHFDILKEKATYVKNGDGSYLLRYNEEDVSWEMDITPNYLIKEIRNSASNFNSRMVFSYPKELKIEYKPR